MLREWPVKMQSETKPYLLHKRFHFKILVEETQRFWQLRRDKAWVLPECRRHKDFNTLQRERRDAQRVRGLEGLRHCQRALQCDVSYAHVASAAQGRSTSFITRIYGSRFSSALKGFHFPFAAI